MWPDLSKYDAKLQQRFWHRSTYIDSISIHLLSVYNNTCCDTNLLYCHQLMCADLSHSNIISCHNHARRHGLYMISGKPLFQLYKYYILDYTLYCTMIDRILWNIWETNQHNSMVQNPAWPMKNDEDCWLICDPASKYYKLLPLYITSYIDILGIKDPVTLVDSDNSNSVDLATGYSGARNIVIFITGFHITNFACHTSIAVCSTNFIHHTSPVTCHINLTTCSTNLTTCAFALLGCHLQHKLHHLSYQPYHL